jgi:hypothetical protein
MTGRDQAMTTVNAAARMAKTLTTAANVVERSEA